MADPTADDVALAIVNRALSRIGEPTITSLADGSRAATVASLHYEPTVREMLRSVRWTFATARVALEEPDEDPASTAGFLYAFVLPDGLILPIEIETELEDPTPFRIEGRLLFTNEEDPILVYIERADELIWDDLFASVVELRLASKIAFELSGKADLSAALFREASMILSDARRATLFESRSDASGAALWTDSL